jgi:Response regulator containing a CheY-like receiver domain and an HTH DNA-binding domain
MGRRGRPPYPDILTPRQWEVLDLVRRGLSDQEIADALDLTLAGAKYHVSEILTKLGVSSREEAAAWQPAEARQSWWRRALALSLAAKVIGVTIVVAALAGVGLLTWGALRSDDSGNVTAAAVFDDLALPSPLTHPEFSREQALVEASQHAGGDIRAADVQVSTMDAISRAEVDSPAATPDSRTGWLVRIRGFDSVLWPGFSGGPAPVNGDASGPTDSATTCVESYAYFPDGPETDPGWYLASRSGGPALPDSACNVQLTGDAAIVLANIALSNDLQGRLPDRVQVAQSSIADARSRLQEAGIDAGSASGGDPVWLVTMTGHFFGAASPTPVPATPRPTTAAPCRIAMAIVSQDGVLAAGSAPSTDC